MRISDAIRRGAALGPQIFGKLRDGRGGSCAVGAMMLGNNGALLMGRPELDPAARCPACAIEKHGTLGSAIIHLNDFHKWTREAIADWIEATVEAPKPEAQSKALMIPAKDIMEYIGEPVAEKALVSING